MLNPSEFYELDHEDYPIVQRGYVNRNNMFQGIARRQTYLTCDVVAKAFTGKGISLHLFNQSWPIGEDVMNDISEALKQKRELGQKRAVEISNDYRVAKAFKKLRSGGSRLKNNHRSRGKSGSPGNKKT